MKADAPKMNDRVTVTNEFASIEISVDECGNGQQPRITDRRSGASRRVDLLALEGLTRAPDWLIDVLADPGFPDDYAEPEMRRLSPARSEARLPHASDERLTHAYDRSG